MDALKTVAEYWDKSTIVRRSSRTRWWQSPAILRHINKTVCGIPIDGPSAGFHKLIKDKCPSGYDTAVSVGCGLAFKEFELVKNGLVRNFYLYELSSERVKLGREFAAEHGVADRMHFIQEDAFSCDHKFDLIYWNNALHHMMDVPAAIEWSRARMALGGVFAMDDYVGASRFQWSDYSLNVASQFRKCLSSDHLGNATCVMKRPNVDDLMAADPSEAADSDRIVPALRAAFPDLEYIPTGGVIYHMALNDILVNFTEDDEGLALALLLDDIVARQGESHYGVAIASHAVVER